MLNFDEAIRMGTGWRFVQVGEDGLGYWSFPIEGGYEVAIEGLMNGEFYLALYKHGALVPGFEKVAIRRGGYPL